MAKTVTLSIPKEYTKVTYEDKFDPVAQKIRRYKRTRTMIPRPFQFNIPVVAGTPPSIAYWVKDYFMNSYLYNKESSMTPEQQMADWYKSFLSIPDIEAGLQQRNMLQELDMIKVLRPGESIKVDVGIYLEMKKGYIPEYVQVKGYEDPSESTYISETYEEVENNPNGVMVSVGGIDSGELEEIKTSSTQNEKRPGRPSKNNELNNKDESKANK